MSPWRAAIDQALLLQKQPALAPAFQQTALPEGMAILIRLASDEGERKKDLAQVLEIDESQLQIAATNYLMQICLYPGSSDLRVLGLNTAANLTIVKEHHRLLLKWLHPDRNSQNQAMAERVNQAWAALKNTAKELPVSDFEFNDKDQSFLQDPPKAGRFPMFLWGVAGLVAMLLIISVLPDSEIYVAETEGSLLTKTDQASNALDANSDGALEQKLSALQISFGEIKKAVLPDKKIEKKPTPKPKPSKALSVEPSLSKAKKNPPALKEVELVSKKIPLSQSSIKTLTSKPAESIELQAKEVATTAVLEAETNNDSDTLQAESQELLQRFKDHYKQGNISLFMTDFSPSARNNRGNRQAIQADYAQFFAQSASRKIKFSEAKWNFRESVIQYKANYNTSVRRKGQIIPESSSGQIEIVMSKENGKLQIQQILLAD